MPPDPRPIPSAPARPSARASPTSTGSTPSPTGSTSAALPVTVKILLENLLRHAGGGVVRPRTSRRCWPGGRAPPAEAEIPFMPARVLLQDFTGVPAVVDLAVMRDAMADLGGDPARVNPLVPADLVIDHSVQVDRFGTPGAFAFNVEREYERNGERYQLLRWAQTAFRDLRVVPPGTGIVHQVNLEFLATVVTDRDDGDGGRVAFPDTLVGTDSHTTMVNGLGVLGYGVGGIEAEAVLLGQPLYQPMPHVVGVRLHGALPRGSTATDLVLVVTEMLRAHGVVGAFVEFAGDGLATLALADRATISNMSPEFGATATLFPIDDETLTYLRLTGRSPERVDARRALREGAGPVARARRRAGLRRAARARPRERRAVGGRPAPAAGPRAARRRCARTSARTSRTASTANLAELGGEEPIAGDGVVEEASAASFPAIGPAVVRDRATPRTTGAARRTGRRRRPRRRTRAYRPIRIEIGGRSCRRPDRLGGDRGDHVVHQHLEPDRDGRGRPAGPQRRRPRACASSPTVKTSLAPGSRAVTGYLEAAGLMAPLEALGFALAGYGCTTCIGNSGPLDEAVAAAVEENDLVVAAVLSGNRNFEGRIHPLARASYLASPPLVVAFALAGRVDIDLTTEPLGTGARRPAGLPRRHLAGAGRDPLGHRRIHRPGALPADLRDGLRGRRPLARAADPVGRPVRLGRRLDVHREAAVLRRADARSRDRSATSTGARVLARARRLGDDRPHLAGRLDRAVRRPPASGSRSTASARSSSTRTAPGAATTR